LEKTARDADRYLEAAKEKEKDSAGRDLGDPLAEVEAKRAQEKPGGGRPFPISSVINGVAWFFTEAPWWVVVLVALPFVARGIEMGVRKRARRTIRRT
jgi:hypothetical protein